MNSKEEIIAGNKLIAEFMGLEKDGNFWYKPTGNTEGLMYTNKYSKLKYHSSWDWLMPVVEKIEKVELPENVVIEVGIWANQCEIGTVHQTKETFMIAGSTGKDKISFVFEAVVEFINWYNQNKK